MSEKKNYRKLFDVDPSQEILRFEFYKHNEEKDSYEVYDEVIYASSSSLSHGDYGGAGSIGFSNIKSLEEGAEKGDWTLDYAGDLPEWSERDGVHSFSVVSDAVGRGPYWGSSAFSGLSPEDMSDVVVLSGCYGHTEAWIRVSEPKNPELMGILNGLADYPVIDDEAMSETEHEWEMNAVADILNDIFRRNANVDRHVDLTDAEQDRVDFVVENYEHDLRREIERFYWENRENGDGPSFEYAACYIHNETEEAMYEYARELFMPVMRITCGDVSELVSGAAPGELVVNERFRNMKSFSTFAEYVIPHLDIVVSRAEVLCVAHYEDGMSSVVIPAEEKFSFVKKENKEK